jgi:hypothetical protein
MRIGRLTRTFEEPLDRKISAVTVDALSETPGRFAGAMDAFTSLHRTA